MQHKKHIFAQHLVWNYGTNQRVTRLLNETEVKELYFQKEIWPACGTVSNTVAGTPCARAEPRWLRDNVTQWSHMASSSWECQQSRHRHVRWFDQHFKFTFSWVVLMMASSPWAFVMNCMPKSECWAVPSQRLSHLARLWEEQATATGKEGARGFHFFKQRFQYFHLFKQRFQSFYIFPINLSRRLLWWKWF